MSCGVSTAVCGAVSGGTACTGTQRAQGQQTCGVHGSTARVGVRHARGHGTHSTHRDTARSCPCAVSLCSIPVHAVCAVSPCSLPVCCVSLCTLHPRVCCGIQHRDTACPGTQHTGNVHGGDTVHTVCTETQHAQEHSIHNMYRETENMQHAQGHSMHKDSACTGTQHTGIVLWDTAHTACVGVQRA